MEKKPGRNDPCLCGSGKKYKKCCEEKYSRKGIKNPQLFSDFQKNPEMEGKMQKVSSLLKNVKPLLPPAPKEESPPEDKKLEM